MEEPRSAALDQFIRERGLRIPVYYDARKEVSPALNQWGTPAYFLLDGAGRVRFRRADPVDELLVQAEALLAAER